MDGDHVVGTITYRSAEAFRVRSFLLALFLKSYRFQVDFGGPEQASLPMLNFEGATKRLRPEGKVGDMVYCRLIIPNRDMEPDVSCALSFACIAFSCRQRALRRTLWLMAWVYCRVVVQ